MFLSGSDEGGEIPLKFGRKINQRSEQIPPEVQDFCWVSLKCGELVHFRNLQGFMLRKDGTSTKTCTVNLNHPNICRDLQDLEMLFFWGASRAGEYRV